MKAIERRADRRAASSIRIVLAAAFLGAWMLACGREEPAGPPPPEVVVVPAARGAVPDRREHVGNVRAVDQVMVRARVRGYLREQLFADGQRVAAGDLLFRIDPSTYEVALAEARGRLARARANGERARRDFARAQELSARKVVSDALLDQRRAERDATAAEEQAAEAAVREAELNLSYCTVAAPIAGRIGRARVDVGNLVGESGQDTVLAEIVQTDPIHVYFAPTERDRLDVLRGAREGRIPSERVGTIPIGVTLGDGTPYPHPGVVDFIDPTIDPTRGTITARALVPNPEDVLKPGQFVRVTAVFPDRKDAVLVPQRAVQEQQGGSFVLVVKEDDTVENRPIQVGIVHDGMQEVTSGLAEGERVIADGVLKARPGAKVTPRAAAATGAAPAAAASMDAAGTPPEGPR
jgi:RND family efflux transporter MFP subunit